MKTLAVIVCIVTGGLAIQIVSASGNYDRNRPSKKQDRPVNKTEVIIRKHIALDGYCPVSIVDLDTLIEGRAGHSLRYRGRVYRFANAENRETFGDDAEKYTSRITAKYGKLKKGIAINGHCPVCVVDMGKLLAGNPAHSLKYEGKTYHFVTAKQKRLFRKNPEKYVKDLPAAANKITAEVKEKAEKAAKAAKAKKAQHTHADEGSHSRSHKNREGSGR